MVRPTAEGHRMATKRLGVLAPWVLVAACGTSDGGAAAVSGDDGGHSGDASGGPTVEDGAVGADDGGAPGTTDASVDDAGPFDSGPAGDASIPCVGCTALGPAADWDTGAFF